MNECDWLIQILVDIEDLAKEIRDAQKKTRIEYAVLASAIGASSYPATAPPNLPSRSAAATMLTHESGQLTTKAEALLAALNLLAVGVCDLKKCCPPSENPPAAGLSSLTLALPSVMGGEAAQGTVTLDRPAPGGGATISLASGNPSYAKVPASVTVPEGTDGTSFTVTTPNFFEQSVEVVITASYNGVSQTASLSVQGRVA